MMIVELLQAMSETRSGRLVSESLNIYLPHPNTSADDRFLGEGKFDNDAYNTAVDLLIFHPKHLTRLHIAILTRVINEDHPLYSLFRSQCYWFASTFIFCAQVIDRWLQGLEGEVDFDNRETDDMFMPYHLFAKLDGCWKGIRIHGIKLVLMTRIIKRFFEEYDKVLAEVFLYSFNYHRLLNF
jgi:hypothetical protein